MHTQHILLCAGAPQPQDMPMGLISSQAMLPVHGKPVIRWILDGLLARDVKAATVVVRADDRVLRNYLARCETGGMALHVVLQERQDSSILDSLALGLAADETHPRAVRILLGDTLVRHEEDTPGEDVIYASPRYRHPERWCLVASDAAGHAVRYIDKQQEPEGEGLRALVGDYHLGDAARLAECVDAARTAGKRQLSDALTRYQERRPISVREVDTWYDFGHADEIVRARHALFDTRHFNALHVDGMRGTVTKQSGETGILGDEIHWYRQLPENLRVFTPRLLAYQLEEERASLTLELYGYPTLAELYLYSDMPVSSWEVVFRRLFEIHRVFRTYPGELSRDHSRRMYLDKTWERLAALEAQGGDAGALTAPAEIRYNGRLLTNVSRLRPRIEAAVQGMLADGGETCIIHGDWCFSNILFDPSNHLLRFIDPRGNFGGRSLYGDPRYDIAKLYHSACGAYDFIVAGLFQLEGNLETGFRGEVHAREDTASIQAAFDAALRQAGYDPLPIRLIEALLFLSMPPLHRDRPARQSMLYLHGLERMHAVLAEWEGQVDQAA